jgi:hypothetical protein
MERGPTQPSSHISSTRIAPPPPPTHHTPRPRTHTPTRVRTLASYRFFLPGSKNHARLPPPNPQHRPRLPPYPPFTGATSGARLATREPDLRRHRRDARRQRAPAADAGTRLPVHGSASGRARWWHDEGPTHRSLHEKAPQLRRPPPARRRWPDLVDPVPFYLSHPLLPYPWEKFFLWLDCLASF